MPKKRTIFLQAKMSWVPFISSHPFPDQDDTQLWPITFRSPLKNEHWFFFQTWMCLSIPVPKISAMISFLKCFKLFSKRCTKVPRFISLYISTPPPATAKIKGDPILKQGHYIWYWIIKITKGLVKGYFTMRNWLQDDWLFPNSTGLNDRAGVLPGDRRWPLLKGRGAALWAAAFGLGLGPRGALVRLGRPGVLSGSFQCGNLNQFGNFSCIASLTISNLLFLLQNSSDVDLPRVGRSNPRISLFYLF